MAYHFHADAMMDTVMANAGDIIKAAEQEGEHDDGS